MKIRKLFLTAFVFALQGCATNLTRLDHGYSIIHREEDMTGVSGAFEKISHHRDFYYHSLKLGTVGQYSVAPSGEYALFESTGKLWLFTARSEQLRDETNGKFSIPKTIEWQESAGLVVVTFYDVSEPRTIELKGRRK